MGGWRGRAFAFQNNTDTVELYLIVVYGRVLIITVRAPSSGLAAMQPQFDKLIRSIKFLHTPPPDLHPIPPVVPKQAAAPGTVRTK